MNSRVKFTFSIGLLSLLYFMLSGSARADQYTYTGNPFTVCTGTDVTYTCTGTIPFVSITFDTTLTGSQLSSLSSQDISGDITSFTVKDNTQRVDLQLNTLLPYSFIVSTDAAGDITAWSIYATGTTEATDRRFLASCFDIYQAGICSTNIDTSSGDIAGLTFSGSACSDPNGWSGGSGCASPPNPTPEPSTFWLFDTGLLGLIVLGCRKQFGEAWRTVRTMC
jgi:hypothetical protein